MAVFRELTVRWGGEEYTFTPSLSMIRRIEGMSAGGERLNVLRIANELSKGGARPTDVTTALSVMFREAMEDDAPSEDEVYAHVLSNKADYIHNATTFIAAILPEVSYGKKPGARTGGSKKKPARE